MLMPDKFKKCIFICSAGHSGSTLTDLLIGSHSRIASLGEVWQLPKNISLNTKCTCGEDIRSCDVWREVVERLNNKLGIDIWRNPYAFNLGYFRAKVVVDRRQQTKIYLFKRKIINALMYLRFMYGLRLSKTVENEFFKTIENNFLLYEVMADVLGVNYIVDSSKSYLKAVGLYKSNPDKVKIILLARDGRAVFHSGVKRKFNRQYSLKAWFSFYSKALPLLERNISEEDIKVLHYEDLVEDTAGQLQSICEFIGLKYEAGMLDFSSKSHHLTNGNNMRFVRTSEIKLDDSWKSDLKAEDLAFFISKASELNNSLGYK